MVGRFVENENVRIVGGEFGERGAAALSPAKIADFQELLIAGQPEHREKLAALQIFKDFLFRTNRVDDGNLVVDRFELLIEIADFHALSKAHGARVGRFFAAQTAQSRSSS